LKPKSGAPTDGDCGNGWADERPGETQQKLDVYANEALLHCLGVRDCVAALVSEENDEPITFDRTADEGKYVIVFDPLDVSSNIDVNVNVGTIFSVYRRRDGTHASAIESVLQAGTRQVAAGYVLYGPSTMLVYRRSGSLRVYS
jgi:fructose-1,6-bisphosphatase I